MERLFRSGISFGVAVLVALFVGGPALAADTAGASSPAAAAAPAPAPESKPAAAPAPMMNKPMMAKRQHASARMSAERCKAIQTALNSHGAKLKVDGRFGKQSREALRKFQSENGLKASGWPGKQTLEKLGVK